MLKVVERIIVVGYWPLHLVLAMAWQCRRNILWPGFIIAHAILRLISAVTDAGVASVVDLPKRA